MNKLNFQALMIFVLLDCFACLNAQNNVNTNLKEEARRSFSVMNYAEALPLYRKLLTDFPKEPEYQYCMGVCLVNLNGDLEESIRLLRQVTASGYSDLSWFYLGRALHLNYSFDDAIKAYSGYVLRGKATEIRQYDVKRLIEMARNGLDYTRMKHPVMVQNVQSINTDELQTATGINGTGKLMRKPIEFCSKTDIRNGYRSWMFLPAFTQINEYIYVAGYERGQKNNKQLFRIRNINHETWGFPELLGEAINTSYNEEFPYFDARTSTLYFSSNGHSSMGGYDIFKSVYDWNSKTWSRPENLGFPINSPYDDFAYITDEYNHAASFLSTRESQPGQAIIVRYKIVQNTTDVRLANVDEIRQASHLEVIIPEPEPAVSEVISIPEATSSDSSKVSARPADRTDYNKILAMALQMQLRADSSARITRELRILAKETPEDSTKKQLISEILKNDKEAKTLQREADLLFAEARKIKEKNPVIPAADSMVILSKEINGIRIYQYKSGITEAERMQPPEPIPAPVKNAEKTDEFCIKEHSSYSDSNPIPKGLSHDTGLVYRVQLGVFSKAKPNDAFAGISPVVYDQVSGTSVLKYYAGIFYNINNVTKALEQIRSKGFPDAFVVAFFNGELITTEKAREIEFAGFRL